MQPRYCKILGTVRRDRHVRNTCDKEEPQAVRRGRDEHRFYEGEGRAAAAGIGTGEVIT